jgi:hypothetical protein
VSAECFDGLSARVFLDAFGIWRFPADFGRTYPMRRGIDVEGCTDLPARKSQIAGWRSCSATIWMRKSGNLDENFLAAM